MYIHHRFTCWSLLYSAVLRSWANSQRLHVILHEWTAFYSTSVLNIHGSGVLTVLVLLVPHETDTISACYVYTIQPCTTSLHTKPHAHLAVTCHLHFQQNDQGLLHATAVTPGWNGHWNKSRTKLTLEKKIIAPLLQGFEPTTFLSQVWRFNHWAIRTLQSSSQSTQSQGAGSEEWDGAGLS